MCFTYGTGKAALAQSEYHAGKLHLEKRILSLCWLQSALYILLQMSTVLCLGATGIMPLTIVAIAGGAREGLPAGGCLGCLLAAPCRAGPTRQSSGQPHIHAQNCAVHQMSK